MHLTHRLRAYTTSLRLLPSLTASGATVPLQRHHLSTRYFSSTAAAALPATSAAASPSSSSAAPSTVGQSFIAYAATHGAQSLVGPFRTAGLFDSCLCGMEIGTLHGGAVSTLVDVVGTLALLAKDHKRGGVSVEMNVSFLNAVKVGETVICKGRVVKLGKLMGFTQVDLYTKEGKLVATGRHTKAM